MSHHEDGWTHSLYWANPYTSPPNGLPRILATWNDRSPSHDDFREVYPQWQLGCGFSHAISFPVRERKHMDPVKKAQANAKRKATIERQLIQEKYPLLADVLIKQRGVGL